jgi:hypothetical protein
MTPDTQYGYELHQLKIQLSQAMLLLRRCQSEFDRQWAHQEDGTPVDEATSAVMYDLDAFLARYRRFIDPAPHSER